jgi:hypothetical protein
MPGRANQDLVDGGGGIQLDDEVDGGRDVVRGDRLDAPVRPGEHAFSHGLVHVREQLSGDGARLDAAHPNPVRGEFLPQGLAERGDAELGRVVHRAAAAGDPARHRPDVDQVGDAARPGRGGRPEMRYRLLGQVQQAVQIQIHHPPPVVGLADVERTEQHDAGVVDQDVEPAELVDHPADGGPALLLVRDVGREGQHRSVLGGEIRQPVLAPRHRGHQGTPAGQPAHGRLADSAARAGDQGDQRGSGCLRSGCHRCSTDVVIAPRTYASTAPAQLILSSSTPMTSLARRMLSATVGPGRPQEHRP